MNVRPLHDRLIVQRLQESAQHAGAIIIPDSAKEKPQQGRCSRRALASPTRTANGSRWM